MRVPSLGEPTPRGRGMGTGRMEADADMARSVKYLYYTGREGGNFRAGRGSGSGERSTSDSLYDDQRRFGFRVVRGGRFPAYSSRAGSLETCGFKQTFWSLLGLWPKVTRARGRGISPIGGAEENRRAVEDAGPYGCVHRDAVKHRGAGGGAPFGATAVNEMG